MIFKLTDEIIEIDSFIDFNLMLCESGQAFRWKNVGGEIRGVAFGKALAIKQDGESVSLSASLDDFENIWRGYFALGDDYSPLSRAAERDPFFKKCLEYGNGIRIIKQDFWEALASFIFSTQKKIPMIRNIIGKFCECFGERIDEENFAFPKPERIARLDAETISKATGCGYRGEYVLDAARRVAGGEFEGVEIDDYETQIERLKRCKGVGPKVADCAALFGLHSLGAFPKDVWINRVSEKIYGGKLNAQSFGSLAGVAQQYIFYYAINHKKDFV